MMSLDDVLSINTFNKNAYSEKPTFDLTPVGSANFTADDHESIDPEISIDRAPPKEWEVDVKGLVSTKKWLSNYGLKRNRLDMHHLLPLIGFRHSDDFDASMRKPICSRYGTNLFQRFFRNDGRTFNISCGKEKLNAIETRLLQAINLYKRRLEWLTCESRRIFGVILEKSVCIVLDIKKATPQQFDQYRSAIERVIREQIVHTTKFNIIRVAEDIDVFNKECIPVTSECIQRAIAWIWSLNRSSPVSTTATAEAVLRAVSDQNAEAVYLFTEGSSVESSMHLLKEKLTGVRIPVHIVSYNCTDRLIIKYLRELVRFTGGRFHAYGVVMEMDAYDEKQEDSTNRIQSNVLLRKKTYGGVPPEAGVREDVMELFEELEGARNNLAQIQGLIEDLPLTQRSLNRDNKTRQKANFQSINTGNSKNEQYMSSREWLEVYGLKARKLSFFDVLSGVAFKHRDGVVDVKEAPQSEFQTDAISRQKLINAKYCNKFPHVRWKDGQIVHVQVTPEVHRNYESGMKSALESVQQRIDWLQQGSRELFGTVIEDQIYFLIDTSASMAPHIQFVKDKLFVLMQEQLRHKQKFNLVGFDSKCSPWKDRMVDVNEKNLQNAWEWIKGLECRGSTNTLAAIKTAVNDPSSQAVYLLSDGRPDQPTKSILAQIQLCSKVPVHSISFNCADKEANQFLYDLARATGGRFHYYSENGIDIDGPQPWESEDIRLLRQELEAGHRNLEQIALLRDECSQLSWTGDEHHQIVKDVRPQSAPMHYPAPPTCSSPRRPHTSVGHRFVVSPRYGKFNRDERCVGASYIDVVGDKRESTNFAIHTKSSILRTMNRFRSLDITQPHLRICDGKKRKYVDVKRNHKRKCTILSSRKWLSIHGLNAKKLNLKNILGPTMVPHKAKYIPILGKSVHSKVFDSVMPYEYVKKHDKKLANPRSVDLEKYQNDLENLLKKMEKRLSNIAWKFSSTEIKEKFSDGNLKYSESRELIIQSLESQESSQNKLEDILLLEKEIKRIKFYLKQISDLTGESEKVDTKPICSEVDRRNESDDELEKSDKKIRFNKSVKADARPRSAYNKRVLALSQTDWLFYPGKLIKTLSSHFGMVKFDDFKEREKVPKRFIIEVGGAVSNPQLMEGDYVLTRVLNSDSAHVCYVPGVVTHKGTRTPNMFTIRLFNGEVIHIRRSYAVKISDIRYNFLETLLFSIELKKKPVQTEDFYSDYDSEEEETPHDKAQDKPNITLGKDIAIIENWETELKKKIHRQSKKQKILQKELHTLTASQNEQSILVQSHEHLLNIIGNTMTANQKDQIKSTEEPFPLQKNQTVIARWADDGWYYIGFVQGKLNNNEYYVRDFTNDVEKIARSDIISEEQDEDVQLQVKDSVIASHPQHESSFAPGAVIDIPEEENILVRFYDGEEAVVERYQVYRISEEKLNDVVDHIVKCEKQLVGEIVIARDDKTGFYRLGKVKERIKNGRQYIVELEDGRQTVQHAHYIFSSFTKYRSKSLKKDDCILAPYDDQEYIYKPARIITVQNNQLQVEFYNTKRRNNIDANACFWITRKFYNDHLNFYEISS